MNQKAKCLSVSFACPDDIEVGDVVLISEDDNTVEAIAAAGDVKFVGSVSAHLEDALTCTVDTKFRERRSDRTAAAIAANGPIVWDATGKAALYDPSTTVAVTGTVAGPYNIRVDSNDKIKVSVGDEAAQTFTLTPATMATITGTESETFNVKAGTNNKFKITVGTGDSQTFTLTPAAVAEVTGTEVEGFNISTGVNDTFTLAIGSGADQVFTLDPAVVASVTGSVAESYNIVAGASDKIKLALGSGGDQTFTLTPATIPTVTGSVAESYNIQAGVNDAITLKSGSGSNQVFILTPAVKAVVTGTEVQGFNIVTGSNDAIKLAIGSGADQDFTLTAAIPAVVTGTEAETWTVVANTNDTLLIKIGTGSPQAFTLTAGEGRTAANIVTDLGDLQDATASAATGHVKIESDSADDSIEIMSVSDNAYTLLGFEVGTTSGHLRTAAEVVSDLVALTDAVASVSSGALRITSGDADDDIVIKAVANDAYTELGLVAATTTGTLRTAANIVSDLSALTGMVASVATDKVKLTSNSAADAIEIVAVTNDAYTDLGFTAAVTSGTLRTAANIVTDLAALTDAVASVSSGSVKITSSDPDDAIIIKSISNSAYSLLGFSEGTTAGALRSVANIIADMSTITGATLSDSSGSLVITSDDAEDDIVIKAVSHDAYTELGFTTGTTAGTLRTAANIVTDFAAASGFTPSVDTGALKLTAISAANALTVEAVDDDAYTLLGFELGATSGTLRTAANIVTDLSAMTDATASVSSNKLRITVDTDATALTIESVANDAYATLGLTEAEYAGASTYDSGAIVGFQIKSPDVCSIQGGATGPFLIRLNNNDVFKVAIGGGGDQTFTLTPGTARTPTQVAADINNTATGFLASAVGPYVKLTASAQGNAIIVKSVTYNAASTLGFTIGTTAAPMTIETLEY